MICDTGGLGEPELAEWLEGQQRRNTAAPIDPYRLRLMALTPHP